MKFRRFPNIFLALSFFLVAQTAVLLHAEIHPFHHHSETCLGFELAQHNPADLPSVPVQVEAFNFPFQPLLIHFVFQYINLIEVNHPVRAPPLSIF